MSSRGTGGQIGVPAFAHRSRGGVGRQPRRSRGGFGSRHHRLRGGVDRRPQAAPSSQTVEVTGSWKKEDNIPINICYHGIPGPVCSLLSPVSIIVFIFL